MVWGSAVGLPRPWGWQLVPMAAQAERRLQALEGKESRAQRRLQELAQRVNTLQEQGQDAHRMAQQAKDGAERATAASGTLSQVSSGPAQLRRSTKGGTGCWGGLSLTMPLCHQDLAQVTQRYVVLKGRVSRLAGVSGGALQRVTQLTAEAQDLLDKASSSKRKLEGEGEARGGVHSPPSRPR